MAIGVCVAHDDMGIHAVERGVRPTRTGGTGGDGGGGRLRVPDGVRPFPPVDQSQGHSPFVWSTIGGVAMRTDRIPIGTGVTLPDPAQPSDDGRPGRGNQFGDPRRTFLPRCRHRRVAERAHHGRSLAGGGDPPRDAGRGGRRDAPAVDGRHRRPLGRVLHGRERAVVHGTGGTDPGDLGGVRHRFGRRGRRARRRVVVHLAGRRRRRCVPGGRRSRDRSTGR